MNSADSSSPFTETKLFKAVTILRPDSYKKVSELVEAGEDVNFRGVYDETYLHVLSAPALEDTHFFVIPIIFHLVDAGLDVNAKDHEGNTPLHVCAVNDAHHTIASALIKAGADPCLLNSDDQDALDLCEDRRLRRVLSHFDLGLWRLLEDGDTEKIRRMVHSWCRVNVKRDGQKLLSKAEELGNKKIVTCLKDSRHTISFVHACLANKADVAKDILKKDKVDVDVQDASFLRDEDGAHIAWPLLAELVRLGHWECAKLVAKKADLNVEIELVKGQKQPLYLWIFGQLETIDPGFVKSLVKKSDLTLVKNPVDLLYRCWLFKCPADLMTLLVKKGLSLSGRDREGYTLRDLIFVEMQQQDADRDKTKEALYFVDQQVIQIAKDGETAKLEAMVLDGYDYINVADLKGKGVLRIVKKEKKTEAVDFLRKVPQLQKDCQNLHKHIENGNMLGARDLLDEKMILVKDRAGRSVLHKAVLYERRYIISHILKTFPQSVKCRDVMLRTPLHYAYAMQDGKDVQDWLIQAGANERSLDFEGKPPQQYYNHVDFLPQERARVYGENVFLLDRYAALAEAIEAGQQNRVDELCESLGAMTIEELDNKAACKLPEDYYRPLLFLCVDHGQEQLAVHLIKEGASYNVAARMEKDCGEVLDMTLEDAAALKEMSQLLELIRRRKNNDQEDLQAQLAVQSALASMDGTDRSDVSTRLSHYKVNCDTDSNASQSDSQQPRPQRNDSKTPEPPPAKKRHSDHSSNSNDNNSKTNQNNSTACVIL